MSENQELKSGSAGTTEHSPEVPKDIKVVDANGVEVPADRVAIDTPDADAMLKDKLKDVPGVVATNVEKPERPADQVSALATPYRAVLWRSYQFMKDLFDVYWNDHGDSIVASMKIKGRKSKGGKVSGARKIAERQMPLARLYRPVIGDLVSKSVEGDLLYIDAMEVFDYHEDKDTQIVCIFYYMPKLDFKGDINWECVRPPIPPLDEQLRIRYTELQRQFRTLVDDPDGVIGDHSSVKVDITATLDGEPYKAGTIHQQWVDVKGIPSKDLVGQLHGHKVGDLFECSYEVTRHDPANVGKILQATVKIHGLQKINTPDVDDALAQDAGFDDLKAFKEKFAEDYTKYTETALRSRATDHVLGQIARTCRVPEVPQEWVEIQIDQRIDRAKKSVGGDMKPVLQSYMARDESELRDRMRGYLYTELMQQLAARWYSDQNGLDIYDENALYESVLSNIKWVDHDESKES